MAQSKGRKRQALEDAVRPHAMEVKKSMCSWTFLCEAIKTLVLILFFYTFSISLTFYNQRFFHIFKFPISITMVHLLVKFLLSWLIRSIITACTGKQRVLLTWKPYIVQIAPPGIFSSLDIGLSNWSFEFITVSLYTMTKSTVIIFILFFSIVFKLEKLHYSLVGVVLLIAAGLFMFTFQSTQFVLTGFLLVLSASFLSGLRWTTSQLVLQKKELGLNNPIDMMYHIQPWMLLVLLPLSAWFEVLHLSTSDRLFNYHDVWLMLETVGIIMGGSILAFMLEVSEYMLVLHTSGLTLSIAGIFKEICTLYLAVELNGDKMNPLNVVGLILCLAGIALHVVIKAVRARKENQEHKQLDDESIQMLIRNGQANTDSEAEDEVELYNVTNAR